MVKINDVQNPIFDWKSLSWDKSLEKLFFLQKRLYKCFFIGDFKMVLILQKLILRSNCARLLAIRYVTQISPYKKIAGLDGKVSLSFMERYELNQFLKIHFNNWTSQSLRKVLIVGKDGTNNLICIPTISDRTWHFLIKFCLEPVHEASFHPLNFSFRSGYSLYDLQNYIFLTLGVKAFGNQKRVLFINLEKCLNSFNSNYLLKKIIAPRSIKLGIFRLLKKNFPLSFPSEEKLEFIDLSILLANILFDGIESLHNCVRFGYFCLYFLKPLDNEKFIFSKIKNFLCSTGIDQRLLTMQIGTTSEGFDFLGWHFVLLKNNFELVSLPSLNNYQTFLKRVKHIINNSNYGSNVKINKLYPLIKNWRLYHKFSNLTQLRFSLFFVKKRAFKVFSKESKQDFYSVRRILTRAFYNLTFSDKYAVDKFVLLSPYYGHMTFWNEFLAKSISSHGYSTSFNNVFCVHCGMVF
jgi:retron-type reverse transcriptase